MAWVNETRYDSYYGGTDDAHHTRDAYGYTTMPGGHMSACGQEPPKFSGSWLAIAALIAAVLIMKRRQVEQHDDVC